MAHPSPSRSARSPSPARLNILALPSRTTLLFGLIVLVIVVPLLASLIEDTPVWEPFIIVSIAALTLRAFLRAPDVERAACAMRPMEPEYPILAEYITRLAQQCKLRPPRLLLTPYGSLHVMGTWTRHYIVAPDSQARQLEQDLTSPDPHTRCNVQSTILHELSHFASRDVVFVSLSRSLLRATIGFMSLSLTITLLQPWLYTSFLRLIDLRSQLPPSLLLWMEQVDPVMAQIMLDPPDISGRMWLRYVLFGIAAHLPLIVGALGLLLVFWPALLRTRELYADAWVTERQGTSDYLRRQLLRQAATVSITAHPTTSPWTRLTPSIFTYLSFIPRSWWAWLRPSPSVDARRKCLLQPTLLYGSEFDIALMAGVAVILLNLTLNSLFLSRYVSSPNATVPFVLGFTVIGLSFLPRLCLFDGSSREWWRLLTRAVLLFTAIKLMPQILGATLVVAATRGDTSIMAEAALALVGSNAAADAIEVSSDFVLDVFVWRPLLLFALVMPLTLTLWLGLDSWLKRRVLTWYGAPLLHQHPVALLWGLTGWLATILWFVVLPVYNTLTVPTAHSLTYPATLALMVTTLIGSGGAIGWLVRQQRRYAGRCPRPECGMAIPGLYWLGRGCSTCGETLHPWLLAHSPLLRAPFAPDQPCQMAEEEERPQT